MVPESLFRDEEVAWEALRRCRAGNCYDLLRLQRFGRICRVEKLMRPYLEALH